jgi:hypothetical protein
MRYISGCGTARAFIHRVDADSKLLWSSFFGGSALQIAVCFAVLCNARPTVVAGTQRQDSAAGTASSDRFLV